MHTRVLRVTLLCTALAFVGCARKQPAQPDDPAFESRWKNVTSAGAEVLTIGDDSGEALMGNVRRAGRPRGDDSPQTTSGGLPAQLGGDQVQRVIRSNLASVKGCYISVARHTPRTGKAIVSFTVGADGRPSNVQVDAPSFQGTALPGCLTAQVSVWSFPPSQKGSGAVSYPFVFVGT
jgi:hypothetical protein